MLMQHIYSERSHICRHACGENLHELASQLQGSLGFVRLLQDCADADASAAIFKRGDHGNNCFFFSSRVHIRKFQIIIELP